MTKRNQGKREKLLEILEKPYVHLSLVFTVLAIIGLAVGYLFLFLAVFYALAISVGVPTLQLVTGAISAGSAAASALAAFLIWRGNVQARKRVLIERVLGPTYSELRRTREQLEAWKSRANEVAISLPFLGQVASDWLYYTVDEKLRDELEGFRNLVGGLDSQRDLCKTIAGKILIQVASKQFNAEKISTVYLWRSHTWIEGAKQGENGRMPSWELVVDSPPLLAPPGFYVHLMQIVDFDEQKSHSIPLLNQEKIRINIKEFDTFWETSAKLALEDKTIVGFRQQLSQAVADSSQLEQKFEKQIKRFS